MASPLLVMSKITLLSFAVSIALMKKINPIQSDRAKLKWIKLGTPLYNDFLKQEKQFTCIQLYSYTEVQDFINHNEFIMQFLCTLKS